VLVWKVNYGEVYAAAAAMSHWDHIVMIVNDTTYGGSVGTVATASSHPAAAQIMQHEYGHSFTKLADEYECGSSGPPGCSDAGEQETCEVNVTDVPAREQVKWAPWISDTVPIPTPEETAFDGVVGLFEGARYVSTGMYRSGFQCAMRAFNAPFCQVPSQAYVLRLYNGGWGTPSGGIELIELDSTWPAESTVVMAVSQTLAFSAGVLQAVGSPPVAMRWSVNGTVDPLAQGRAYTYTPSITDIGTVTLELRVHDETPLVHPAMAGGELEDHHAWTITVIESSKPFFTSDPITEATAAVSIPYTGTLANDAIAPTTGDTLTFSKASGPDWLKVVSDGRLSGTPTDGDIGPNQFTVRVTNAKGLSDEATLHIEVNTCFDTVVASTADSGACSLRWAIAQASDGDTIIFGGPVAGGTIHLASTLEITKDLIIDGRAQGITVSGDSDDDATGDVLIFNAHSAQTVILKNLTLTKGYNDGEGGAINVESGVNLTMENCTISDSYATSWGGAIRSYAATLNVIDSTITGNDGDVNGGIVNWYGMLVVSNSAFMDNATHGRNNSAILNLGAATVQNSTFSGNSGNALHNAGSHTLVVVNSTLVDNDVGLTNEGILHLSNTIIANSISGGDCINSGTLAANSHNLIEDGSCSPALSGEPLLSPLQDNGGPTPTYALLPGSPAIDAGDNAICPAVDPRGEPRPVDYNRDNSVGCDIGAFELQSDERYTAIVDTGGIRTFGDTLVTIEDNNTGVEPPGEITVIRHNQPPGGGAPDLGEMPFYVEIDPTIDSGLDTDLTICYTDWEVSRGGDVNEADLVLFRYADGTWTNTGFDGRDLVSNCVSKYSIAEFSIWTLAAETPLSGYEVAPLSLTFGEQNVDAGMTISQAVVIINHNGMDLDIINVNLVGDDADQFAILDDSGKASLAPGGTRTVWVSLDPNSTGIKSAALEVTADDGDGLVIEVALEGIGVETRTYYAFLPLIVRVR
jgi:hypothetical protein